METIQQVAGGSDLIAQLFLAFTAIIIILFVISSAESLFGGETSKMRETTTLLKDTVNAQKYVDQDPEGGSGQYIQNSKNEANGIESTYSMYLMLSPDNFDTTETTKTLKHVFHKGFKSAFPVMSPGVFVESGTNTLRIYMNSAAKWNNYVSVPNVPIGKWFHLVILMKGKYMDVYINGNVTQRHEFPDVPRLNKGNVYIMWPVTFPVAGDTVAAENVGEFKVSGAMKGMVSRLKYYSYALTYATIDQLMSEGPSSTIESNTFKELPPYFHDDWWVTRY